MPRTPNRVRIAGVAAAWVVTGSLLAACGSTPEPSTPANLFEAMPPTTTLAPVAVPSAPVVPTTKAKAKAGPTVAVSPWKLSGDDEFNGTRLSSRKWGLYDSVGGFGNGKRRPSAMSEGGGSMSITATGDTSGGMADTLSQLYGRWEFRARTDLGRGFGSAILLWPDSENTSDGEIDMMEVPDETRHLANFVLHSGPQGQDQVGTNVPGHFDQWHTFALEWLPTSITWYIDGQREYVLTDRSRIPTTPMHLAIQLDEGPEEDWIPAPDGTTPPQLRLQVDYERTWSWTGSHTGSPPAGGG